MAYSGEFKRDLGSRPLPDVPADPADPAEFADRLTEIYERLDAELDEIFDGVSDEAAHAQPAEGEWSAAHVLAHLIVTERATQMGAYLNMSGQSLGGFPNNDTEILDSITAVYADIQELLGFWKRTEAETVALVRNLPQRFLDRKIDYNNLGQTLLMGLPVHTRSHLPQIQAALAAHWETAAH